MINTYHSSAAPPPVPPRLHSSHQGAQPVLIPTTMLPQGHSRTLMRFMFAVVLLNLLLSMLGFIYLYMNGTPQRKQYMQSSDAGTAPEFSMEKQYSHHVEKREAYRVFARMEVRQPTKEVQQPTKEVQQPTVPHKLKSGRLEWDTSRSKYSHPYINYYKKFWLTIEEPGHYFVYSRVTFSKGQSMTPLNNRVDWRKSHTEDAETIMVAYCQTISTLCTATAEDVIKLEKGNQLSVWTDDTSLVHYDGKSTTFGLYKL